MQDAIAPFAGDEIAVLLLVYILGEVEVEVDRVAVMSDIRSRQRAFFIGWWEAGSFT
jgi:hypothetical protein